MARAVSFTKAEWEAYCQQYPELTAIAVRKIIHECAGQPPSAVVAALNKAKQEVLGNEKSSDPAKQRDSTELDTQASAAMGPLQSELTMKAFGEADTASHRAIHPKNEEPRPRTAVLLGS